MNILVVCHYGLYQSLTASFVHNQVKAYAALGQQVRVIVPIPFGKTLPPSRAEGGPLLKRRTVDGVELFYVHFLSLSNFGKRHLNTPSAIAAILLQLPAILKDFTPDVIHAHTLGLDSGIGAWLKKRLRVPLVITTHGSDAFIPYKKGELPLLKKLADQADHLVCVSTLLKRRMKECKVSIPMSVILNGFQVKDTSSRTDKPPFSILQAGYLVARKKADMTIRAVASLRGKYPEVTLDIVGSGSELKRFQTLCGELGVSDVVRFHGFLPNPETLAVMAKSRFFIMPSVFEGFGIVYLEAMACGCITIGTEGEGIADLIVSGKNGFLVPPDDPDAIVQTVEWCLGHPEEAAAIAEQGRKDAKGLTWEKNAAAYMKLFEELQHGRKNTN